MNSYPSNPIGDLCWLAVGRFSGVGIEVDTPRHASSLWYVDIKLGKKLITVQWLESKGFGLCYQYDYELYGYGEGPEELYPDVESCFSRVASILTPC